jgi:8-hydroxy-5-deazaflavin:NADPH oxidoreductase
VTRTADAEADAEAAAETAGAVAILGGTGALGLALATRLAMVGVPVRIGSRDAARAAAAAASVRTQAVGATVGSASNADAVDGAATVIVAVPFTAQAATLKDVAPALRPGQLLVDATVPLATAIGGRPTQTVAVWAGSAAQQAQALVPEGVAVVAALHTVSAATLADLTQSMDEDVLICGDRRTDKDAAAALIERIPGLRCVDAGRLEMARVVEQLTPLMISINVRHRVHAGIRVTGLA